MLVERRKILNMLHKGKITVDEAEELLTALEESPELAPGPRVEIIGESAALQKALAIRLSTMPQAVLWSVLWPAPMTPWGIPDMPMPMRMPTSMPDIIMKEPVSGHP